MKTKTRKSLPKTSEEISNGSIHSQRVRCGKSNCKCSNGDTHTAYYFFTRIKGKFTKFYIRKSDLRRYSVTINNPSQVNIATDGGKTSKCKRLNICE